MSGFDVVAYCVMPDHVHALVKGSCERSDLQRLVRTWKQVTAFAARRDRGIVLWQRSHYEHLLRDDEVTEKVAVYILGNPVRAGRVRHPLEYRWIGSFTTDVSALIDLAHDL